ncbi:MAG TPA: tRNA pseudouridine(55) synthase TruB [Desulfitobacteriaceae bacterium]|nr:tRNA pseudouridine(55) synthase TruB [Desulfitobacteriaceae bacterium]
MDGVINVLKPTGMTSSNVVVWLRKNLHTSRVGHVGTLDPGAAGVLPICVEKATRIAEYLVPQGKLYRAEITFGIITDTQDSFGKVLQTVQPCINRDDLQQILPAFCGQIQQLPPMYSAVRHKGKHLYEYARKGYAVERAARTVSIACLNLLSWSGGKYPRAVLDIECSKGTYIRTLCHDLGEALGCGAHMSFLLRLRSGPFGIQESWTLEEIEECIPHNPEALFIPVKNCLDLPALILSGERAKAFANGLPTRRENIAGVDGNERIAEGIFLQVFAGEELLGIGVWRENSLYPHKVLRG